MFKTQTSRIMAHSRSALIPPAIALMLVFSCKGGDSEAIDASADIPDADLSGLPDADLSGPPDAQVSGTPDAMTLSGGGEGIDILFVIDNSGSMREEQMSLTANFNQLVNVLENIDGGLPDIHIGVVSTDLGAGPYGIMGCTGNGDNGLLQNAPAAGACATPSDLFIRDEIDSDGVTRIQNYTGTLADTFSCIAELGTTGCGFERPLEAMRRALNGSNVQNDGFLRPDAFLAVVIVADEDDCSAENVAMYDSDPALDNVNSALGPLASFRCFEFGVSCQPDTPRVAGVRSACVPRPSSTYMHEVEEYVTFLKGLKSHPGLVMVAGIIGDTTPVVVGLQDNEPTLNASCTSASGDAAPGVRLQAFLDGFPQRNTSTTICNEDLSGALTVVANLLATVIVSP